MADITPKTKYARDGDVHIAWQELGDGPIDLLIAPGYISHLDLNWTLPAFAEFMLSLSRFCRVILFDKRGTGLSDHAPDAAQFERRMRDMDLVLDAAKSERAVIFGLSEGGPLASLYAATHPERVESLVLCGTFARGSIIDEAVMHRFQAAVDDWGEGHTASIFLSGSDGPVARRFIGLFERAAASPGIARSLLGSIRECDVTSVLPNVAQPVLILHRADDPFAKSSWSDELESLIPNATRRELEGDDHLPWMGNGTAIVRAVEEWITGRAAAQPPRSRFATVLFTDIVDSTHRLAVAGDERWADVMRRHNDACHELFERHSAWLVQTTGDGFMACFDTPEAGVRCAFEMHRVLQQMDLTIRAGLHCGEIERTGIDEVVGMTVNLAARVASISGPGQTLSTEVLGDLLVGSAVEVDLVGTRELKGVPGTVMVVELHPIEIVVDLTTQRDDRVTDALTLQLARRAPGFMRSLARLTGAQ